MQPDRVNAWSTAGTGAPGSGGTVLGTAEKQEVENDGTCELLRPVISGASNKTDAYTIKISAVYITRNPEVRGSRASWQLKDIGKSPSSVCPSVPPV